MEGFQSIQELVKGYDYTLPIARQDEMAFKRVQQVLFNLGYGPDDFLEGGLFDGLSTNQLLEICDKARDER